MEWLEHHGLYAGVTRNEAALALARRKMLGHGWSEEQTVEWLMEWTASKANGLSKDAARMDDPTVADEVQGHYWRIVKGISRAIAQGKVAPHRPGTGRGITAAEAEWIFSMAATISDSTERYRVEVYLFCALGFAKDRGGLIEGPGRFRGAALARAEIPATLMQRWPYGSAGAYKRFLTWAVDAHVMEVMRNYRNSCNPRLCRARAFAISVDSQRQAAAVPVPEAVMAAAKRTAVHPRQVEHAVIALRHLQDGVSGRYGKKVERRLHQIVDAYDEVVATARNEAALPRAA